MAEEYKKQTVGGEVNKFSDMIQSNVDTSAGHTRDRPLSRGRDRRRGGAGGGGQENEWERAFIKDDEPLIDDDFRR
jgi:hypothetical protein